MAQGSVADDVSKPAQARAGIIAAAIGMHLGLLVVCASAVYTGWQRTIVTMPQWAMMLLVAATLLVAAISRRAGIAQQPWARGALALGGLLVLFLAYDPQLDAFPALAERLPGALLGAYPGIALPGVLLAFVSWLAYRSLGGESDAPVPFRAAAWWAAGLLVALSLFAYSVLHGPHDLPIESTLRPILAATQGGLLVVVLSGIGGGEAVRLAPHVYLALALICAFARNMAFPVG